MSSPLLSICIPTFNRKRSLSQLLSSLLPQCIEGVEIIVSDNASNDGTFDLCAELLNSYNCLHYQRHNTNIGYPQNLLSVLRAANGRYLWMLGDDELVHPDAVKRILSVLKHHKPSLLVGNLARIRSIHDDWKSNQEVTTDYDRHNLSLDELLRLTGGWISLISINIIRVDRFEDWYNSYAYNESDYIGFEITLHAGSVGNCYLLRELIVGRLKQPFSANRFGKLETYALEFFAPLNRMVNKKVISSSVRNSIARQMYMGMLGVMLLQTRINKVGDLPSLREWYLTHAKIPIFWILIFPILVMPRKLLQIVVSMSRYFARRILDPNSNICRLLIDLP